jgi:putative tricarboxylic transport membrane protein
MFTPLNLGLLMFGSVVGLIIGALPGLGPVFACALFLPLTFRLETSSALVLLSSLYTSSVYGGSITSILMNVPGTPGNVATTFDGHSLAKQGRAGYALGASTGASFIGGVIGVIAMVTIAPPLADFSLKIGPAEYFKLAFFGLSMVAVAAKGDTMKGMVLGILGVATSFIGRSQLTGSLRFTMGIDFLEDGISFVSASIGLFAISQAIILAEEGGAISGKIHAVEKPWSGFMACIKHPISTLRGSIIGVLLGIVPGVGISTASFVAYMTEQRTSKNPESFGKGNIKGVIAPESSNNACVSGELIPAFALGIPGGSTAAIFIAALTIHGLRPGLEFFSSGGVMVNTVFIGMFLAQVVFLIVGMTMASTFAKITRIPNAILVPIILVFSFVGAYAESRQMGDVVVALLFGLIGYVLFKYKWPITCMVLGMVLGHLAENNFHRALQIGGNSYSIFVTKPISLTLLILIVLLLLYNYLEGPIKKAIKNSRKAA